MKEISLIFILGAVLFLLLYVLFKSRKVEKKQTLHSEISGMVLKKSDGQGIEGIKVLLGKLNVDNGIHKFISEKGNFVITDKDGQYKFIDIDYGEYWVYIFYNGKKIVRMVRVSEKYPNNSEVLLTV